MTIYQRPSPYSGPPGQWASAAREASGSFWMMAAYLFMLLFALICSACFFGSIFVAGYNGAAVGGGVSMLVMGLIISVAVALYWGHYRDASRRAKELWSGMNDLDHAAAQLVRREMDAGF